MWSVAKKMTQFQNQVVTTKNPILTVASLIIIVAGMKAAAPLLTPLFLALFTAIVCWPLLSWLHRRGVPSGLAVSLVVTGLIIVMTILGAYVFSSFNQFTKELPAYQANLHFQTAGLIDWLHEKGISIPNDMNLVKELNAGKVMKFAGSMLAGLGDAFANIFFILLTVIFLMLESFSMPNKVKRAFGGGSFDAHSVTIIESINRYLGIKAITSLVTGILIAVWVMLLHVDFPVLWGVLAFMLNFVPNIGSIIAAVPTVLLALVQLGGESAMLVAFGYLTVNTLVGNVWETRIMGQGLGLSTLVVFLSLTFWGWMFGTVGMLLSVPFTMIAKIILENNERTYWIAVLLGPEEESESFEQE
jgi:predicted PurR-regulated permease PerM